MTRDDVLEKVLAVFKEKFEIENPDLDVNLREEYEFDSIDAIDMLIIIEKYLEISLNMKEKRKAFEVSTINQMVDFILVLYQSYKNDK